MERKIAGNKCNSNMGIYIYYYSTYKNVTTTNKCVYIRVRGFHKVFIYVYL